MMMKAFFLPLVAAMTSAVCVASEGVSEVQAGGFAAAVGKAWKARDVAALMALSDGENVPEGTRDAQAYYWQVQMALADQLDRDGGADVVTYMTLKKALEERPEWNVATVRWLLDDREVNGRRYVLSRPAVGMVSVLSQGRTGVLYPVGLDGEGKLRLLGHRPVEPVAAVKPIAPQGVAKQQPEGPEVERFVHALREALEKRDLRSVMPEEGVPVDLLDDAAMMLLDGVNSDVEVVSIELLPPDPEERVMEGRKPEQPVKWGGERWYGYHLPYAGRLRVEMQPKEGKDGFNSVTMIPVGLRPDGKLELLVQTQVTPQ